MDYRTTWAEIDLDNLTDNLNEIQRLNTKNARVLAVVKANAYGHGSVQIAKRLKEEGVDFFAVSSIYEAIELRQGGIYDDILVLGYTPEGHIIEALKYDIIFTIYSIEFAKQVSRISKGIKKQAKAHIKIDSGMNRLGFQMNDESIESIVEISNKQNIEVCGYFTHLATADESDKTFSEIQYNKFIDFLNELKKRGIDIKNAHISNSAGIIDLPNYSLDIIRPGIMLYGYHPSEYTDREVINLKKVMTLKTRISNIKVIDRGETVGYGRKYRAIKKTLIATIPIGYADGFTRLYSNKISLCVKGEPARLVGNVCMDQSFIECPDDSEIRIGDEVTIFGEGVNMNSADDLAKAIGTINYEVLCMVGRRIPRIFKKNGKMFQTVDYLL